MGGGSISPHVAATSIDAIQVLCAAAVLVWIQIHMPRRLLGSVLAACASVAVAAVDCGLVDGEERHAAKRASIRTALAVVVGAAIVHTVSRRLPPLRKGFLDTLAILKPGIFYDVMCRQLADDGMYTTKIPFQPRM